MHRYKVMGLKEVSQGKINRQKIPETPQHLEIRETKTSKRDQEVMATKGGGKPGENVMSPRRREWAAKGKHLEGEGM